MVITIAFGQIIKEDSLKIPKNGWLNVHFSKLPKWRGAAPVQHAILNGESSTGISIFQLEKGMDTGPVYLFEDVIIQDNEKTPDVLKKMSLMVPGLVLKTLEMITGNVLPIQQSGENISYAPKISKEDEKKIAELLAQKHVEVDPAKRKKIERELGLSDEVKPWGSTLVAQRNPIQKRQAEYTSESYIKESPDEVYNSRDSF